MSHPEEAVTTPHRAGERHEPTDGQLMSAVQAGSAAAFAELYDRYAHRAYGLAYSVCRNDHHAEDAVQEAFLSIWRSRATFDPGLGAVAAWLMTVVRHRALDAVRHNAGHARRRASEDLLDTAPAPGDVSDHAIARSAAGDLHSRIARLPDVQREVITLAYFRELTQLEIATRLGLPLGTVKSRTRLGLGRLRADLAAAW